MNIFGLKAFLRAIAIFVSVFLVKFGIEQTTQIGNIYLKVLITVAIILIVLLIIILPSFISTNKLRSADKDREAHNEK